MNKGTLIILLIFSFSIYKTYEFFNDSSKEEEITINEEKPSKKNSIRKNKERVKENKDTKVSKKTKDKYLMKDKRVNVIAPNKKSRKKNRNKLDPITRKARKAIPNNLERVLQYEISVWSRGLTDDEISILKNLWSKYSKNEKFNEEDLSDITILKRRNILNAIRASKPSLIREVSTNDFTEEKLDSLRNEEDYNRDSYDTRENLNRDNYEDTDKDSYEEEYQEEPIQDEYRDDVRDDRFNEEEYREEPIQDEYRDDVRDDRFNEEEYREEPIQDEY